jgi:hypothetical protein
VVRLTQRKEEQRDGEADSRQGLPSSYDCSGGLGRHSPLWLASVRQSFASGHQKSPGNLAVSKEQASFSSTRHRRKVSSIFSF